MFKNLFFCLLLVTGICCDRNNSQVNEVTANSMPQFEELTVRQLLDFLAQLKHEEVKEVASRTYSAFDFGTMLPAEAPPPVCDSPTEVFYDEAGHVVRIVKIYRQQFGYEFRVAATTNGINGFTILSVRELKSPIVSTAHDLYSIILIHKGIPIFLTLQRYGSKEYTSFHDLSSIVLLDRNLNAQRVLRIREAKTTSCGTLIYNGCDVVSERIYNTPNEQLLSDRLKVVELLTQLMHTDYGKPVRELKVNVAEYAFLPLWTFEDRHGYLKDK
ncbi:hypothetical protein KK083_19125 [Fulvivirgaceae bacterium PWU4]|uniref:Uncharacterized protein n=1 Tax=Chryseosolibacter histidini TaxID=2782349 RepID=A0AAP2DME2_9BACT|nr:hypothetical protein [Chryseosolibacter histidini]MBT1699015.1 hypothetical protein [Chryseosolibacter histidini]